MIQDQQGDAQTKIGNKEITIKLNLVGPENSKEQLSQDSEHYTSVIPFQVPVRSSNSVPYQVPVFK